MTAESISKRVLGVLNVLDPEIKHKRNGLDRERAVKILKESTEKLYKLLEKDKEEK